MKEHQERISSVQIFFMVILFEIGSTPLFLLGGKAKQDSWIAMSIGSLAGFLLLLVFLWIQKRSPRSSWMNILQRGFGRIAGTTIGILYCLYFAYESMRNVRDLGELAKLVMLPETPMFLTMLIFVSIGGYAISKGAEIVFNLPELLLPLMMLSYAVLITLLLTLGTVDFTKLQPILEQGILPVVQAALPDIVSFPFGQMLVFLMIWPLWNQNGVPVKSTLLGYFTVSLFLIFMNVLNMAILGPAVATTSQLPFLKSARTLSHFLFIERLDLVVTILLFYGLLMKMTLFFFCAVRGIAQLTQRSGRFWVIPLGLLIYASSFIEQGYAQHFAIGLGPSLKVDVLFQIAIPLLILSMLLIRKRS
ncbi:GerAB/ArcD/ProY family transporter [Paenibacillus senegalimassiliensis]|uniref:GerAB/ArcD/ProY family transporter n=1 Tax=Paenibacillus senegalimassiliensis TaxID=1737426 RepID=UPI000AF4805C|nr:endospore germination permease [Paenibacillus senegalimassiliensis]